MAAAPGTVVVTVFAGVPPEGTPAPPSDRAAGFASGREAMQARHLEDLCALDKLRAESIWLPFLDRQYVDADTSQAIAPALREILDRYPDRRVLTPLGLFHSDHALVFDAVWRLMHEQIRAFAGDMTESEGGTEVNVAELDRWWFYEDMPYRRLAGLVAARIMAWRAQGYSARRADPVVPDIACGQCAVDKVEAMQAYESQLGLLDPEALIDLNTSESYWQLQWSPVPL